MRISKFIKVDRNVLIEYIYDDGNLIGEPYKVSVNIRNKSQGYIASDTSATLNTQSNTLFQIDPVTNSYGRFDITSYPFLQVKDYASGFPIRHDIVKIHFPINYTFAENIGIYLKVYGFDSTNKTTYDLSNFYYDITNIDQSEDNSILGYTNPPIYFQEKLWGKTISLNIPSLYAISRQRGNDIVKENSINYNLTNGIGFDQNSPVLIDFQFILGKSTINSISTYTLSSKNTFTIPQSPEFEKVGVKIEESVNGDFFEIYGTYNGNIGEFNDFINKSVYLGNRYYVEYNITMYEQNIRGKSQKIIVTEDFLNKVEYRPIIKYSTTTAIIDVEMNLIDAVDSSQITRRASYGMLQDQVSKYSLRLMKINLSNAHKPKIYNLKNTIGIGPGSTSMINQNNLVVETVKVPYPVLIDRFNVIAKSDSVLVNKNLFHGIGKILLVIYPFDNIIKFVIANQVEDNKVNYMDLTNMGEIKMVIKNQTILVESQLYTESDEVDLSKGFLAFKIVSGKINDIRKINDSGSNVFYITSSQQNNTTVIYSGLYMIYDSIENISNLNQQISDEPKSETIEVISDQQPNNTAVATRRVNTISTQTLLTGTQSFTIDEGDSTDITI